MTTLKHLAVLSAAAALLTAQVAAAQSIRFWTIEEQPERLARQEALAAEFKAKTGVSVDVIPVTEADLGKRATAAYAAGDLPDVIYHTLQYVQPWAEAGILDLDANTEVVEELGKATFAPGALAMADADGDTAAVPADGWTQMVVYRKDLFDAAGLAAPDSYANILAAVEKLHDAPNLYGFVAPTKIDENFMSQVLEHVLLANGATPVSADGVSGFDTKSLGEALDFYKAIAKASPPGELYWKQSRELYFAGKAAMIIWSPFILDELAGLRDSAPPTINDDPTSRDLAAKTGIVTTFAGPSNANGAAWADIRYFGVTTSAETNAAIEFVKFSLDEGYPQTLAIAPEGKFPVRRGDGDNATKFVDMWSTLPVGVDRKAPMADLYASDVLSEIVAGLDTAKRWGVAEGQLSAASKVVNSQVINRITRQFIDDEITVDEAVDAINSELGKL